MGGDSSRVPPGVSRKTGLGTSWGVSKPLFPSLDYSDAAASVSAIESSVDAASQRTEKNTR